MRSFYNPAILFILALVLLILNGCSVLYAPMAPNIPLMEGKNEVQAEIGIASDGASFKTAYSPVNHLAVQFNAHSGFVHGKRREVSAAVGAYFVVRNCMHVELYGGYGYGSVLFNQSAPDVAVNPLTSASGYYNRPYGQLDLGFSSRSKGFYFGWCIRTSYMDFYYTDANHGHQSLIGTHIYNWIAEPYIMMNIRLFKPLSLSLYCGMTGARNDYLQKDYVVTGGALRLTLFQKAKTTSKRERR
jgi:hypothetical protein